MTWFGKKPEFVRESAKQLFCRWQAVMFLVLIPAALAVGIRWEKHDTAEVLISAATVVFLLVVTRWLMVAIAAHYYVPPTTGVCSIDDPDLPIYTVLVPLNDEARIVPSHIKAMRAMLYPCDKLQIIHLVEKDDLSTIVALDAQHLESYFERCYIPDIGPRTKPKALNYGLEDAIGKYCVIFDAEDKPDSDQLLKSVALFRASPPDVVCLQGRLKYTDGKRWFNRFYSIDYITHFWELLRGLSCLKWTFPLGGTSNHVIVEEVRKMAIAVNPVAETDVPAIWDPYNVTEDADLAIVIARSGKRIIPLDSFTEEESPNHLWGKGGASRQRRRWLKGYLQTALVHTRHPRQAIRQMGLLDYMSYLLMMFGTPLVLLLIPPFWGMTITYLINQSIVIQHLFPTPLYYLGMSVMLFGNIGFFYQSLLSCYKEEDWKSVPVMFLTPVWWLFNAIGAYLTLGEIINPKTRSRWNKTDHGHSLVELATE